MILAKQALWLASCCLSLSATLGFAAEPARPPLIKVPFAMAKAMENTPIVFQGRPLLLLNHRDDTKNNTDDYVNSMYLYAVDLVTGERVGEFAKGHSFVNAFVEGNRLHVFATEGSNRDWFQSIYHFWTDDLKTWEKSLAIQRQADERLFNCSVCRDDQGYLMAYESNKPVQFCYRFARSKDLNTWEEVPHLVFTGEHHEYSACPCIRFFAPYYYVIYLHAPIEGHKGWISYIARSPDLRRWELSSLNPVLEASAGEGANNSDVDLFEWEGNTYLFYATGDQQTWSSVRLAMSPGPLDKFLASWFPEGVTGKQVSTIDPPVAATK